MNEHGSPIKNLHAARLQKNLKELNSFLEKNYPNEPPQFENLLIRFSTLDTLSMLTMSAIRSLSNNEIEDEMCSKLEIAIRTLIYQSNFQNTTDASNDQNAKFSLSNPKRNHNEIQILKTENDDLKKNRSRLEEEIESLKEEVQQKVDENRNLNSIIVQNNEEKFKLQTEILSLNDTIDKQSEKEAFHETNEKGLNDEISQLKTEKGELINKIADLKQVISNKNEKISQIELDQKKLQLTIHNEKAFSSKLQAELDIQGQSTEKRNQLLDLVNESQKLLNESRLDNLMLVSKSKSLESYIDQLLNLAEELETRLAMLEEDKDVSLNQIDALNEKVKELTLENTQQLETNSNMEKELHFLTESIEKFEHQTGFSIHDIESVFKMKNSLSGIPQNFAKPEKVEELEKVIVSLLKYIHNLIATQENTLPLLNTSDSFIQDENVRENILSSIEDIKVTFSLAGHEEGIQLLDTILSNSESINKVVDDLSKDDKFGELAAVSVLCSANTNLRHLLDSAHKSINEIESLLPSEYQSENKFDSITRYINDSIELNTQISNAIDQCPFEIDQNDASAFIEAINQLLYELNDKLCEPFKLSLDLSKIPTSIQNYVRKLSIVIDNLQNDDNQEQTTVVNTTIEQLQNELKQAQEEIERDRNAYYKELSKLHDEIASSKCQIEDYQSQKTVLEENLDALKDKYDDTYRRLKVLETQRDDLINLCNNRKKSFSLRKKSIMENEKQNYELQLAREKEKFQLEKSKLTEQLNKKIEKIKLLKKSNKDSQALYESELSKQAAKFSDLYQQFIVLKEDFKKQQDEQEKKYKEQMSQLEERVTKSLLVSHDDELSINSTITFIENTPTKSIFSTPIKSTPMSTTLDSLASPRMKTPEIERFVARIGHVLSKHTNDNVPWTRSKILTTLERLVARIDELENNSPKQANTSFITPKKLPSNANDDNTLKFSMSTIKQLNDWQKWANDLAIVLKLKPVPSTAELQTALRDLLLGSNAKCKLVQSITSLRDQKKIMKKFNNHILFPLSHKSNDSIKFKSLILFARLCIITRKLTLKIAIRQEQQANSPRISSRFSPRTNISASRLASGS